MMTEITKTTTRLQDNIRDYNWQYFLKDNITGSWYQTAWIAILALVAALFAVTQFNEAPTATIAILAAWGVGTIMVVVGTLFQHHTKVSRWLKNNLISSVSNALLSLLMMLVLGMAARGIALWAFINANFNPAETAPEFQSQSYATWGVIWGARKLLMTGRMTPEDSPRVWLALWFILGMWALTYITGRPALRDKLQRVRQGIMGLWILSPVILYVFLAGIANSPVYNIGAALTGVVIAVAIYALFWTQKIIRFSWMNLISAAAAWPAAYTIWWAIGRSGILPPINVDTWGGLMLSLIVASSVVILSMPIGMMLALGRRSEVYGVPAWITWPVAIGVSIWGFTTTPQLLADSRSPIEQLFAFWPIAVLVLAYGFQRAFKGNVVAGASTAFIELIRSVPLITLLFMGIIMAPFFFSAGTSIAKPWPVIVGYTLFSAAYTAEVIRGGLQAIPVGQYEASDSLGLNGFQKMRFIILPQAIRIVIPAIVGQFIGAFKSSSLVSVVGLMDLLGIIRAIVANPQWLGLRKELYVFLFVVYFTGSFVMSSYSRRLEVQLGVGER
ncbi:MAG: amino acid ABC transporter permease [Chloroflexota bacterium]